MESRGEATCASAGVNSARRLTPASIVFMDILPDNARINLHAGRGLKHEGLARKGLALADFCRNW
jgi:hypothetical protein